MIRQQVNNIIKKTWNKIMAVGQSVAVGMLVLAGLIPILVHKVLWSKY